MSLTTSAAHADAPRERAAHVAGAVITAPIEVSDDELAGSDEPAIDPWATVDELVAAVAGVDRAISAMTAWRLRLVDQARRLGEAVHRATLTDISSTQDIPRRTMVAELACALRVSERAMGATADMAQVLADGFPTTLAAMGRGEITSRHADVVVGTAQDLEGADRAAAEAHLLELAGRMNVPRFRSAARRWRERHHPRDLTERHEEARAGRCVLLDAAPDGMAWLSAHLPAPQAWAIYDQVSAVATSLHGGAEQRSLPQLRADVLADLLLDTGLRPPDAESSPGQPFGQAPRQSSGQASGHPPGQDDEASVTGASASRDRPGSAEESGEPGRQVRPTYRGIRPTVMVTVPVLTLLGHSQEPGHLEGYGPIDPATARELAAEATSFMRILTHPESGAVLSVGRTRYVVPADMRRFLRLRDETCRFPGCGRRARHCDVDHTQAWNDSGVTECQNLAHLCRHHHRLKHQGGWRVVQRDDGVLRWTSPTGRQHATEPALPINHPPDPPDGPVPLPEEQPP